MLVAMPGRSRHETLVGVALHLGVASVRLCLGVVNLAVHLDGASAHLALLPCIASVQLAIQLGVAGFMCDRRCTFRSRVASANAPAEDAADSCT